MKALTRGKLVSSHRSARRAFKACLGVESTRCPTKGDNELLTQSSVPWKSNHTGELSNWKSSDFS